MALQLAKEERDSYKEKFTTLDESLNTVNKLVQAGDAEGFISALGLPDKMFIDYAISKLKYQELSPEEKLAVDAQKQQQQYVQQMQQQNQTLQQQYEQSQRQQRTNELESGLLDQSVAAMAREYDTRVGTPGAFRNVVVDRGIYYSQVKGQDISAQQAISEAIKLLGLNAGTQQNQPQAGSVGTHPSQNVVVQNQKPVLPNIQSTGTSPLAKKPRNLEDIIKIRDQRIAQQGL